MSTTTIHVTTLTLNDVVADPEGTAIDASKTGVITLTKPARKVAIRITNTTASQKAATILAGDNPPADAAGQGNLVVTCGAGDSTPVSKWVVLESARFLQNDGTIQITYAASMTGFVEAIQLP